MLGNLFDNATQYADTDGQVTITLQSDGTEINLCIANTGSRVAEADGNRVFDRFWRADAARATDGNERRYGLGLPLCRKLMTLLGGSVSVSTSSGGTFAIAITLPRRPVALR